MFELDMFAVGEAGRHGEAIVVRFDQPDKGELATVVIDAGFQANGKAFVDHIKQFFGTRVDIAVVSHPDADHIGGMPEVIRQLDVGALCIHRLGERGGSSLPAADAVDDLIDLAIRRGCSIHEPFSGLHGLGGAFQILGPTETYYEEMVLAEVDEAPSKAVRNPGSPLGATLRHLGQRFLASLPIEVPFDDAGGTNPRNNSSVIALITVGEHRLLFPADAGVPAIDQALDWAETHGHQATSPAFIQIPHHGSRHNASSALLDRMLGPIGGGQTGEACANVGPGAEKHPAGRVANAYMRRPYPVYQTRGRTLHHHSSDAPERPGWTPAAPMDPMEEPDDDE